MTGQGGRFSSDLPQFDTGGYAAQYEVRRSITTTLDLPYYFIARALTRLNGLSAPAF